MDWVTALAIVTISAGITISVVVLLAVGSLRRNLNDGSLKQAQQIRRMAESISTLNVQLQTAQARIETLTEANRRLTETVVAIGERVSEDAGSGTVRLLH